MDAKDRIITQDLDQLDRDLHDAHGHAATLASAILNGAHLVARVRRGVSTGAEPQAVAELLQAFGGVTAEQSALGAALEGAAFHLGRLPVRIDIAAAEPE